MPIFWAAGSGLQAPQDSFKVSGFMDEIENDHAVIDLAVNDVVATFPIEQHTRLSTIRT